MKKNIWVYDTKIKFIEPGRGIFEFEARIKFIKPGKTTFEFTRQELNILSQKKEYLSLRDKN